MPSQRRPDGDLRRLDVAHLSHHDDVGIAPENAPQPRRKGQIDLRLHCDLHHPGDLVFHRILDRHNSSVFRVQGSEESIQRGRFP